jgi:hypothetical protein
MMAIRNLNGYRPMLSAGDITICQGYTMLVQTFSSW